MNIRHLLVACALAAPATADSLAPASVLVFPKADTGPFGQTDLLLTAISVTNTNLLPADPLNGLGGSTGLHFQYVMLNSQAPGGGIPDASGELDPGFSLSTTETNDSSFFPCQVSDVVEFLTPADTMTVNTLCHSPSSSLGESGYLVVTALDPNAFKQAWSHNYLIGSEFVLTMQGETYALPAIPFRALGQDGDPTDLDQDGQQDFDGIEYVGIPDTLYIDSSIASFDSQLVLIGLTGGASFTTNVRFDVWNDNEEPLSVTTSFSCWMEQRLIDISFIFEPFFLFQNTLHDPTEFDADCDGFNDYETFWARIEGFNASSTAETIPNAALLGALTGRDLGLDKGRPLWRSKTEQFNGDFLKYGANDPEFP